MNLRKCDAGKVFIAPSGRTVTFLKEVDGSFLFAYEDDPLDGLALSKDGLMILDELSTDSAWNFSGRIQ
jgi:hypothetical protein